jgi:excisionase family DNA binding protein
MAMTQTIGGVEYMDAGEAAAMLGVKKATLYAYVSRGMLRSYKQGVGRRRLYRRAEVELLHAVHPSDDSPSAADGRVLRDVYLPDVESWASDH